MQILQLTKEHGEVFERLYAEALTFPTAKIVDDYVILPIEPARQFLESNGIQLYFIDNTQIIPYNYIMLVNK